MRDLGAAFKSGQINAREFTKRLEEIQRQGTRTQGALSKLSSSVGNVVKGFLAFDAARRVVR